MPSDENQFRKGESGNPAGKASGTRNRTTLAMEAVLAGEAEALTRKAAAVVGVAVGAIAAGRARSQEQGYQERGYRTEYRPVRVYGNGYRGGCGSRNSPIFDEDGNRIGARRVPAC